MKIRTVVISATLLATGISSFIGCGGEAEGEAGEMVTRWVHESYHLETRFGLVIERDGMKYSGAIYELEPVNDEDEVDFKIVEKIGKGYYRGGRKVIWFPIDKMTHARIEQYVQLGNPYLSAPLKFDGETLEVTAITKLDEDDPRAIEEEDPWVFNRYHRE